MKKIFLAGMLIISGIVVNAQKIDSAWFYNNYIKKEVYIPMRDGVKLFTAIYLPKNMQEGEHPFLMTRTPYSCMPYGGTKFFPYWRYYWKEYLKEGYIMVQQDVRGRFMSEGEFVNVRPFNPHKKGIEIDEASDTYDAIDWLITNIDGNNGKVGVYGNSYPGFYSTMAAASGHPALKAVSPQAPVTNWFIGDDFHHNGAFFQMDAFSFYTAMGFGFGVPRHNQVKEWPAPVEYPDHDNYKFFLEAGCIKNLTRLTGDSIKFWNEIMQHPDYDEWWKARDARNAMKKLQPAMLWVGGLFDAEDCWGAWNAYKAAEEDNPGKAFNKIVEGPWSHGQWQGNDGTHLGYIQFGQNTSEYYQQNIEIPFFNYFLKSKGDISKIAEANIFITGANQWQSFQQWPPANKKDKALYLQPGGKLSFDKPLPGTEYSDYISDPAKPVPYEGYVHFNRTKEYMLNDQRFAARRPDVLVFQTDTLTRDITVAGNVIADILVGISTTDADFIVKIIDVFPESSGHNNVNIYAESSLGKKYPMGGYQMLVRGEVFRGRYRNSFEKPEAFVPGKIEKVKFELPPLAHCFKKGHRIMVQVQSSWFPLVDRNPQQFVDIYHCDESAFVKSRIQIYHNAKNASRIILPVLE